MGNTQAPIKPLRMKLRDAANSLAIHYETLRDLVNRGTFTVIAPNGRGVGKHIYLHPDEVELYATQGAEAVREFRIRKGRLKSRK